MSDTQNMSFNGWLKTKQKWTSHKTTMIRNDIMYH